MKEFKYKCGDSVITVCGKRGKVIAQKKINGKVVYDIALDDKICFSDVKEDSLEKG